MNEEEMKAYINNLEKEISNLENDKDDLSREVDELKHDIGVEQAEIENLRQALGEIKYIVRGY